MQEHSIQMKQIEKQKYSLLPLQKIKPSQLRCDEATQRNDFQSYRLK